MADVTRLPGPNSDLWDWQLKGACRGEDPEIFFHPEGERGPSREQRIQLAKSICSTCPVLRQCAEHALAVREPYGVWGAMSEDDREAVYTPLKQVVPIVG
jgi:WhiB family redox-sensing transcriptional regulator